jgi:formate dehydrogenase major subunit
MSAMMRKDGVYLLPACTQFETVGSAPPRTARSSGARRSSSRCSSRSPTTPSCTPSPRSSASRRSSCKNIKVEKDKQGWDEPNVEDILREINKGTWTIGYTGQSPERLKLHMKNMHTFDVKTLKANGGPCDGEYFGLPWPCYGTPEMKHPGTPNLYDTSKHVMDGGGNFRANFGVEKDGVSLLAEDGSASKGADLQMGYPEFDHVLLKKLGWWDELTEDEKKKAEGKNWKTDPSGGIIRVVMKVHGCHPFGNAKARAVVWNFPDPVPLAPRADVFAAPGSGREVPATTRQEGLLAPADPVQVDAGQGQGHLQGLPDRHDFRPSGRVRGRRRGNPLQPVAGRTAAGNVRRGESEGCQQRRLPQRRVHVGRNADQGRMKVRAQVTERVAPGTVFLPFHFSGWWQGKDMLEFYPEGAAPIVRGEAVNQGTTYGYDSVTMMQETKTTLCRVSKA